MHNTSAATRPLSGLLLQRIQGSLTQLLSAPLRVTPLGFSRLISTTSSVRSAQAVTSRRSCIFWSDLADTTVRRSFFWKSDAEKAQMEQQQKQQQGAAGAAPGQSASDAGGQPGESQPSQPQPPQQQTSSASQQQQAAQPQAPAAPQAPSQPQAAAAAASQSADAASPGAADAVKLNEQVAQLSAKLKDATADAAKWKDACLRAVADTENQRRIAKEDVAKARSFGMQSFAKAMLTIVDEVSLAILHFDREEAQHNPKMQGVLDGLIIMEKNLHSILASQGVKKIDAHGAKFDPNRHEAVYQAEDPTKEPGTVLRVEKDGFTLNDRVLRPSIVGVVKKSA